jgi:hypothetical protein
LGVLTFFKQALIQKYQLLEFGKLLHGAVGAGLALPGNVTSGLAGGPSPSPTKAAWERILEEAEILLENACVTALLSRVKRS